MSVVEARGTRRTPRVSTRFLRSELRLVFRRRRNLAGLLVLAAVPVFIAIAVKVGNPGRDGDGPPFLTAIVENGLFVALTALALELGLFLPLAVAAVSGDAVAGEANIGTLRYLLTVPVDRARLLLVKYTAALVFTLASTLTVVLTGIVLGLALFGGGSMTLLSGAQVGFTEALARVLGAALYATVGLGALAAVGLFFSTLTEQPIGAMIATVLFSTTSYVLDSIPQVSWLHPYLITHHWLAFVDLFRAPVAWDDMQSGAWLSVAYALVFWLAAWARMTTKDVSS